MFEKLKSILYKNQFDVFFGKVYEESNLHGIAVNYYFTNSIVKIPNKNFVGLQIIPSDCFCIVHVC